MIVGVCRLAIEIPEAHSLKEKRAVIKAITNRVQNRFNVAIAEVDGHQQWQYAELGFACVSTSAGHADQMIQRIVAFIEENLNGGYLADCQTEILHLD